MLVLHQMTSSGSAEPLKTRLTNSRTMERITCFLRLAGPVDISPVVLALLQIALLLQDVHHGHDGGVGDAAMLQHRFINLATVAVSSCQTTFMISSSCSVRVGFGERILIN